MSAEVEEYAHPDSKSDFSDKRDKNDHQEKPDEAIRSEALTDSELEKSTAQSTGENSNDKTKNNPLETQLTTETPQNSQRGEENRPRTDTVSSVR